MSCSIHIKSYIAIPPLNFGFHSCVAMDVVTLGILLAGHPDAGNVCGYATVSYCNVSVCDSATQKRLRASSLLRTFLYSVCGSATQFRPTRHAGKKMCACRTLHLDISDLHFYFLLLGARGCFTSSSYHFLLLYSASSLTFYFLLLRARGCYSLYFRLPCAHPLIPKYV